MKIVLDSTPLIYLNKVGLSFVFDEFQTFVPQSVFDEVVVGGKELSQNDAIISEELINSKKILVEKPFGGILAELEKIGGLGVGEMQAIALAKEKNAIAIIDDEFAKGIGELFGVKVHGAFFLIFCMVKSGKLSKKAAVQKIEEMIESGWRVGIETYLEFAASIKKI